MKTSKFFFLIALSALTVPSNSSERKPHPLTEINLFHHNQIEDSKWCYNCEKYYVAVKKNGLTEEAFIKKSRKKTDIQNWTHNCYAPNTATNSPIQDPIQNQNYDTPPQLNLPSTYLHIKTTLSTEPLNEDRSISSSDKNMSLRTVVSYQAKKELGFSKEKSGIFCQNRLTEKQYNSSTQKQANTKSCLLSCFFYCCDADE